MNLLFIQGGSRLKLADDGNWYTDPNFTSEIWNRYLSFCDQLTVVLRREKVVYEAKIAQLHFNPVPNTPRLNIVPLDDLTRPATNYFNILMRRRVKKAIYDAVSVADKVIIRSTSDYTFYCYKACLFFHKEYMFEVVGFAFEGLFYQGIKGKLFARRNERWQKQMAWDSKCSLYVTSETLQKRYPSQGQMFGCSDVELNSIEDVILINRIKHIEYRNKKLVIGTCGRIADKNKGQHLVIKAMAWLKDQGYDNIEYQLVGFGDKTYLEKIAEKYGLLKSVLFFGGLPHAEINHWLDTIDIYIQPSYSEGLSRAIVEAMSRACPVIASTAGGNSELISEEYIFERGNYEMLAKLIISIKENQKEQARRNFEFSKKFNKELLDAKRNDYIKSYVYI